MKKMMKLKDVGWTLAPLVVAWSLPYLKLNHIFGINLNISANAFIFKIVALILSFVLFAIYFLKINLNKIEKWINKREKLIIILIPSLMAILYMAVTFNQQVHFGTHAYDFGIYNHAAYNYGRLNFGYFEDLVGMRKMADHFEPILFFPGLINTIFRTPYILLAFEAIVVALGFIPIYLIGKKLLKNKLAAILMGLAYLFFMGVLKAVGYPVHPGTWLATFYGFMLYFMLEKRYKWYYLFVVLALMSKESASLHLLYIGLFVLIVLKEKIHGTVTFLMGISWYLVTVKWLMPELNSGVPYVHGVFGNISNNPVEFVKFILMHPIKTLQIMFDQSIKAQTFWLTLASSGFLAILSPAFILLVFPMLFERLVTEHFGMIAMEFHYSIPVSVMLIFSAILAIKWMSEKFKIKNLAVYLAFYVFACSFLIPWRFGTPFVVFKDINNFKLSEIDRSGYDILEAVPKNASVIAQESLVSHLSYRERVGMFGGGVDGYEYAVLSKEPNFPSWPVGGEIVLNTISSLRQDKNYTIEKENKFFILFKKEK